MNQKIMGYFLIMEMSKFQKKQLKEAKIIASGRKIG